MFNRVFINWFDAFHALEHYLTAEPTVILFDEISWMGDEDPTFIGKFKIWWDDAVLMKIIRLWRKISDKITGRKWKKLELAEPEDDLIGEIIKRYHVSHRRANEIFNCEIREMVKSIHAKMSVLTW